MRKSNQSNEKLDTRNKASNIVEKIPGQVSCQPFPFLYFLSFLVLIFVMIARVADLESKTRISKKCSQ